MTMADYRIIQYDSEHFTENYPDCCRISNIRQSQSAISDQEQMEITKIIELTPFNKL